MDHTPFILASYGIAFVILGWTAFVPVIRGRRFRDQLRAREYAMESRHAPEA
jgi:heme exporter protein CcmD